jgi:hypothetical protein
VGWWRWTTATGSPPLAFESPGAARQGEIPGLPQLGPPGRPWRRRLPSSLRPWNTEARRGGKRVFPLPGPARFACGRAHSPRRACRWATRPCPAPRAGAVRPAAREGAAR